MSMHACGGSGVCCSGAGAAGCMHTAIATASATHDDRCVCDLCCCCCCCARADASTTTTTSGRFAVSLSLAAPRISNLQLQLHDNPSSISDAAVERGSRGKRGSLGENSSSNSISPCAALALVLRPLMRLDDAWIPRFVVKDSRKAFNMAHLACTEPMPPAPRPREAAATARRLFRSSAAPLGTGAHFRA